MTTHQRLTAKRVDAVLHAAIFGIDNDDTYTDHERDELLATIRLMHRRFVAEKESK